MQYFLELSWATLFGKIEVKIKLISELFTNYIFEQSFVLFISYKSLLEFWIFVRFIFHQQKYSGNFAVMFLAKTIDFIYWFKKFMDKYMNKESWHKLIRWVLNYEVAAISLQARPFSFIQVLSRFYPNSIPKKLGWNSDYFGIKWVLSRNLDQFRLI